MILTIIAYTDPDQMQQTTACVIHAQSIDNGVAQFTTHGQYSEPRTCGIFRSLFFALARPVI